MTSTTEKGLALQSAQDLTEPASLGVPPQSTTPHFKANTLPLT